MMSVTLKEVYPVKEILSRIGKEHMIFNGDFVYMGDKYYEIASNSNLRCSKCNLKGAYFIKEKNHVYNGETSPFVFRLYGQNEKGDEIRLSVRSNEQKLTCNECLKKEMR